MDYYSDKYEERHALIIGIDKYKYHPNELSNAVNDAKELKNVLIKDLGYRKENIRLLTNNFATSAKIKDALCGFIDNTGKNDSLVVFFAGHGVTRSFNSMDVGFIVPYDGTESNINSLVRFNELVETARLIPAKHIFFIMDCCYGGLALLRGNRGISSRFLRDLISRRAIQVLTAGRSEQSVSDGSPRTNHSIFTEYLIKALKGEAITGNGVISASSVINYMVSAVGNDPASRQTPNGGTMEGEGDLIMNLDSLRDDDGDVSNDIMVERFEAPKVLLSDRCSLIQEVSSCISDRNKFIALDRFVNEQLVLFINNTKDLAFPSTKDGFREYIDSYFKYAEGLITIASLLSFYYVDNHKKIILKIISNIHPCLESQGVNKYGNAFVIYVLYLAIIICAMESMNYDLIESVFKLSFKQKYSGGRNAIIDSVVNLVIKHYGEFGVFFPDKNYRYPLNEYVFKKLQPILDDVLFLADSYEDKFISAELLIAIFFATRGYNKINERVWAPSGRYKYILSGDDIHGSDADTFAERVGFYSGIDDMDDFYRKFASFIGEYF